MDTSEKALFLGFGFAVLLVVLAVVLIWKGSNNFRDGIGLKKLGDHKFEIEGAGFKVSAVASSVGGLMIVAGVMFASLGVWTAPNYEANLLTGVTRVTSSEAIPRSGMVATTIGGDTVTLDDVRETKALSAAWGGTDQAALSKALKAAAGKDFLATYAKMVKDNPNSVVIVDYGGQTNSMIPAEGVATVWSDAFKATGLNENQIVVVPMGNLMNVSPTVSVAKPET